VIREQIWTTESRTIVAQYCLFSHPETAYAKVGFSWYFSISPDEFLDSALKRCKQTSFGALYISLPTAHSSIFLDSLADEEALLD
jgi:hypothetical protein